MNRRVFLAAVAASVATLALPEEGETVPPP